MVKKKIDEFKLITRIIAALAVLIMVGSVAGTLIYYLVG